MNRPLITIQCGNYANYIGSHFWNLQESGFVYSQDNPGGQRSSQNEILEVDNDVLYREGITLDKQVTYTPRLIVVDLKGSLGALPECGELYGKISIPKEESLSSFWSGGHQVFREEPYVKNEYLTELEQDSENVLNEKDVDISSTSKTDDAPDNDTTAAPALYNLEDQVQFWSDYLGAQYHPRSVLLTDNYQHNNTMHPFDVWGLGRDTWTDSSNMGDQMEDRIRCYAEECDVLGGFQVVSDYYDGFGGLSSSLIDLLSDEYNNKSVISFPTSPVHYSSYSGPESSVRVAGAVLTLTKHLQSQALVTPLSLARDWYQLPGGHVTTLPHVSYTPQSHYSSSSVLALALDTATLQYRLRSGQWSAGDVCQGLVSHGRRLATLGLDLPLQMSQDPVDYFENRLMTSTTDLAPGAVSSADHGGAETQYNTLVSVRGMKSSALFSKRSQRYNPCSDPASYLESCIASVSPNCRPVCSFSTKPVITGKPFPHIFNSNVNSFGEISSSETRANNVGVEFTTCLTSWSAGNTGLKLKIKASYHAVLLYKTLQFLVCRNNFVLITNHHDSGPAAQSSLDNLNKRASKLNIAKLHRLAESGVESEEWSESVEILRQQLDNYVEEDY